MRKEGFAAALDKRPDDWDLRLIYADWLEEQGLEAEAGCQRWMAARKVAPLLLTEGVNPWRAFVGWNWSGACKEMWGHCMVAAEVWITMGAPVDALPTRNEAEEVLLGALRKLGEVGP